MNDAPWRVELGRRAERGLRRLDPPIRQRVIIALARVAEHNPSADIRRLTGEQDLWRLRVGDWRVLFVYDATNRRIIVSRVLPRGRAYPHRQPL